MRYLWLLLTLLSLSACAPVILGRTPTPAAVGKVEGSLSLGYPFTLTRVTVCEPPNLEPECSWEYVGPGYWPTAAPLTLLLARGVTAKSEQNLSFMLLPGSPPLPGLRVGSKGLLFGGAAHLGSVHPGSVHPGSVHFGSVHPGSVHLAGDFGASLFPSNLTLDAGLLAGAPLGGAELYGAVRAFGNLYFQLGPGLAGSLTVGGALPLAESRVLLELTLLAQSYNGLGPAGVQPTGFSLVPALSFNF